MIRFENVTKSFRVGDSRKLIVDNVSLTFPRGRSIGLIGRNGAGKSTLLRMIGGSAEPDAGRIVRTVNISWPLGFGGAFQLTLTGAQNVRFIARIYGVDTDDLVAFVEDFSELGEFMHMPVRTYSSGMRARLAFGVSMGIAFDVYLVDEITAVGDTIFKRKCSAAFRAKADVADLIMVSHSAATLKEYCTSGIVLEEGQAYFFDEIDDALAFHAENMDRNVRA